MTDRDTSGGKELTARQSDILKFIVSSLDKKGYPPSIREIGAAVGLSSCSSVHNQLKALELKGYLRRDSSKPRTIEVMDHLASAPACIMLPLMEKGRETHEKYPVPAGMLAGAPGFLIRMRGDSMKEAAIIDGDYIVIRRQNLAEDGDLVAAMVEDETIIRRYFSHRDYIRLEPENRRLTPILLRDVLILGLVRGVLRTL